MWMAVGIAEARLHGIGFPHGERPPLSMHSTQIDHWVVNRLNVALFAAIAH